MKNNKYWIAIFVLLLLSNAFTYGKVSRLENEISGLNNTLYRMNDRIGNISRDVSRVLDDFKVENSWTRKVRAEAVRYNDEDDTAGVEIEVEFNELSKDETITILVQDDQGALVERMDMTEFMNDNMSLAYTTNLAIGQNYYLSLVGESTEAKRGEDLGVIRLLSLMEEIVYVDGFGREIEFDEGGHYKSIGMDIMVHTVFEKDPFIVDYFRDREIVNLRGEVYVDDVLTDTIDLLNDENWNILRIDEKSGEVDQEIVLSDLKPGSSEGYNLDITGKYEFASQVAKSQQVELYVVFTDNKGEEYGYQLYHIFR